MMRVACVAIATLAGLASAESVDFVVYSDNAPALTGLNVTGTLSASASTFTVTLANNSTSGYIANFYIELGDAVSSLGNATILNTTGVSFSEGGTPTNPGGGLDSPWAGNFFSMKANNPKPQNNAVNPGESISVTFEHDGSFSLSALMDALAADEIRMVQHYRGFGANDDSLWLKTNLAVVPLPPAAWAGLGLLGGIAGVRTAAKRRQRA